MTSRRKYIKREQSLIVAVQLGLETDGFSYRKWGGEQTCKPGDWVVDNEGDIYTVDNDTFSRTYRKKSPGVYQKVAPVWAERAENDGSIETLEGTTHYHAGDYIVFNNEDQSDGYAVEADKFEVMYKPVE